MSHLSKSIFLTDKDGVGFDCTAKSYIIFTKIDHHHPAKFNKIFIDRLYT